MNVRRRTVVAALGSEDRGDDGVGIMVAARVAERVHGVADVGPVDEPLDLLGLWDGADLAVVIDAVCSGSPPGTLHCIEVDPEGEDEIGARDRDSHLATTHGIGLKGVCRLAGALGTRPRRVVVLGIEGADFSRGADVTPQVAAAVPGAVRRAIELVKEGGACA